MSVDPLIALLPHGPAARMLDAVCEHRQGELARGHVTFPAGHRAFDGHLPDQPIVPGVLIIEALAQLSGIILLEPDGGGAFGLFAGVERFRLRASAGPDERIELEAKLLMRLGSAARFEVAAHKTDGTRVAEGELMLGGVTHV